MLQRKNQQSQKLPAAAAGFPGLAWLHQTMPVHFSRMRKSPAMGHHSCIHRWLCWQISSTEISISPPQRLFVNGLLQMLFLQGEVPGGIQSSGRTRPTHTAPSVTANAGVEAQLFLQRMKSVTNTPLQRNPRLFPHKSLNSQPACVNAPCKLTHP